MAEKLLGGLFILASGVIYTGERLFWIIKSATISLYMSHGGSVPTEEYNRYNPGSQPQILSGDNWLVFVFLVLGISVFIWGVRKEGAARLNVQSSTKPDV